MFDNDSKIFLHKLIFEHSKKQEKKEKENKKLFKLLVIFEKKFFFLIAIKNKPKNNRDIK